MSGSIGQWLAPLTWKGTGAPPFPIAIMPKHVSPRIVAQKGRFTVHGDLVAGFEFLALALQNDPKGFTRSLSDGLRGLTESLREISETDQQRQQMEKEDAEGHGGPVSADTALKRLTIKTQLKEKKQALEEKVKRVSTVRICRIVIPHEACERMLDELMRLDGVTHSTLFPDLDGLGSELRWKWKRRFL
jgi:hypothetical protein